MLEAIITIRTPPNQAKTTEKKIKFFLLGLPHRKTIINKSINSNNDTIIWRVNAPLPKLKKIQRNVLMYDKFTNALLNTKLSKKFIKKHLSLEDQTELTRMLLKLTTVDYKLTTTEPNN